MGKAKGATRATWGKRAKGKLWGRKENRQNKSRRGRSQSQNKHMHKNKPTNKII